MQKPSWSYLCFLGNSGFNNGWSAVYEALFQPTPKYCISHFWGRQHILNVWTLHDPNPHFSLSKFPTMPFRILVSAFMAPGGPPWGMTLWCCLLDDAETPFLDIFGWFMNKISMPWNPKLNIAQLLKQWALWRFSASQLATLWSGIKVFVLISVASLWNRRETAHCGTLMSVDLYYSYIWQFTGGFRDNYPVVRSPS